MNLRDDAQKHRRGGGALQQNEEQQSGSSEDEQDTPALTDGVAQNLRGLENTPESTVLIHKLACLAVGATIPGRAEQAPLVGEVGS